MKRRKRSVGNMTREEEDSEEEEDTHLESPEEGEESAVVPGRHVGVDHRGQAEA